MLLFYSRNVRYLFILNKETLNFLLISFLCNANIHKIVIVYKNHYAKRLFDNNFYLKLNVI